MNNKKIGAKIRECRKACNLSQKGLAITHKLYKAPLCKGSCHSFAVTEGLLHCRFVVPLNRSIYKQFLRLA